MTTVFAFTDMTNLFDLFILDINSSKRNLIIEVGKTNIFTFKQIFYVYLAYKEWWWSTSNIKWSYLQSYVNHELYIWTTAKYVCNCVYKICRDKRVISILLKTHVNVLLILWSNWLISHVSYSSHNTSSAQKRVDKFLKKLFS